MAVIISLLKIYLNIIYFFLKFLKVDNKKILMMSRQYNKKTLDYSMIKENINRRYPDYKVIILAQKLNKKNIVKYFFHIHIQMYHLATSRVCLVDTYIIPVSLLKHRKDLTIIQLCHGVGNIKKFGYQTLKNKSGNNEKLSRMMKMHKNYDYLVSTSKETSKFYSEAFDMPIERMLNFGPPKIDYLLNIKSKRKEVLKKYKGINKKPIILYVSTFRTYKDDYLKKFINNFPFDKYNLIINIHPVAYKHNPDIDSFVTDSRIYRCKDTPTTDLLSICNIAITDYSSFVFDSAIADIPTYLFVPDYNKYVKYNGLNIDIFKELDGYVFKNSKDLFQTILNKKYNKKTLREFKNKYIENCDGTSTDKLVDFMISKTKKEGNVL